MLARALAPALACLVLVGCQKVQARVELKKGNAYYKNETYREALEQFQKGLRLDPGATFAWRSVGLTAMALYRPGVEGEQNEAYAQTAIDAFEKYLRAYPRDVKVEEYLITVLISAGRHEQALQRLEQKARTKPGDQSVEQAIIATLIKANRLEDALARARRAPRPDPTTLYSIGVAAWARSYSDPMLDYQARAQVVEVGLDATKQALDVKPDYFEAMAYYNLLFREKAKLATDPLEAQKWFALAEEWTQKAIALRERQQKQEAAAARSRS